MQHLALRKILLSIGPVGDANERHHESVFHEAPAAPSSISIDLASAQTLG